MLADQNCSVACDNPICSNFEAICDGYSIDGEVIITYCGVCGRDITHTAVFFTD
jgi:hypothetical protein